MRVMRLREARALERFTDMEKGCADANAKAEQTQASSIVNDTNILVRVAQVDERMRLLFEGSPSTYGAFGSRRTDTAKLSR